jgi:hypothetical protein
VEEVEKIQKMERFRGRKDSEEEKIQRKKRFSGKEKKIQQTKRLKKGREQEPGYSLHLI